MGLTHVGVGEWQQRPAAFDADTGLIESDRGMGLAGQMFDLIKANLSKAGIHTFELEVLKANEPGQKAYLKSGFVITRAFDRFTLKPGLYPSSLLLLD